jgi:hypothetical protein
MDAFTTVTGTRWIYGIEETVTGFPIRQGLTTSTIAFVTLLTEAGSLVREVQVPAGDMDGVRVRDLSRASDDMLWRIAEHFTGDGRGARALAELTMRARDIKEQAERERSYRIERSRRDAARLIAA